MEETFNTKAIILDRFNFRESDMKLIVWSKERGKMELVARGALKIKSKTAGHIEPITLSRLMIIKGKRDMDYIGTAEGRDFFRNIKDDLEKINLAGRAVKLVKDLSRREEGEGEEVFFLLSDFLNTLNTKELKSKDLLYSFFILKFLKAIGFVPNLQSCLECNASIKEGETSFFNFQTGSLICDQCKKEKNYSKISSDCIKILRFCLKNDFDKLDIKMDKKIEKEVGEKIGLFLKYNF